MADKLFQPELETTAVTFVAAAASKLPDGLRPLVFASPVSSRSPDLILAWHPGYRSRRKLLVLWETAGALVAKKLRGVVRLFKDRKAFRYKLYGRASEELFVTPVMCGKDDNGAWKTSYIRVNADSPILAFGFGETWAQDLKAVRPISILAAVGISWRLAWAGCEAAFKASGTFIDRLTVLHLWLGWVSGLEWLEPFYLERILEDLIRERDIKKIACVHEAHFYTRVIWDLACRHNIRTSCLQHASVTEGKRWYFPQPLEIQAGQKLPETFFAYCPEVVDLLKPHYPGTKFELGCSFRYSHWKTAALAQGEGSYYLFTTALAGFDNEIMIEVMKKILSDGGLPLPMRLRMHPYSRVTKADRGWLDTQISSGKIILSRDVSLRDDIAGARVVVGMSTTVLEEALLIGRPAVQVLHDDYLEYIDIRGVKGAFRVPQKDLSASFLKSLPTEADAKAMRRRFGLDLQEVDMDRLFERKGA